MHFGIFLEERRRGLSEGATLRETIELADAAEAGGLDGVWLGEIHFNGTRSIQSAPLALASFMAARTRRVRVGIAVQVLPLGNPLRIAEEAATVDQLSEGRLDFGIGRSGSARTYDLLGVPYGESQARFLECLEIIRLAWKGQPFSYEGRFYRFRDVTVSPTPYQVPHPPLRMAANSPDTFPQVARLGLPLFIGVRDLDIPLLRGHLKAYREAWRESGQPGEADVYLRLPVYAAPTEADAREEPRGAMTYFFQRHIELIRAGLGRGDTGPGDHRRAMADRIAAMSYDELLKSRVAFGTAASLRDRLGEIAEDLGLSGIVAELNPSGLLSLAQVRRTLDVLTREVVPTFR
jgi:alkanesulfonate monooxygenase SsuD/methylene tetrahydromethanopterin reductase-like flavin-dependent oxidoreductase (luciferase family)